MKGNVLAWGILGALSLYWVAYFITGNPFLELNKTLAIATTAAVTTRFLPPAIKGVRSGSLSGDNVFLVGMGFASLCLTVWLIWTLATAFAGRPAWMLTFPLIGFSNGGLAIFNALIWLSPSIGEVPKDSGQKIMLIISGAIAIALTFFILGAWWSGNDTAFP